jgi:hypothetical protein
VLFHLHILGVTDSWSVGSLQVTASKFGTISYEKRVFQ